MTVEVLDPGALSTVQDVAGRRAWRRYGVPLGGAVDPWSARMANRLVGNPDDAALIEVAVGGTVLRVGSAAVVAVTGGLRATVDGIPMPADSARLVAAGGRIELDEGTGLRGYVAVGGGVAVEPVLGSRATDLRTGFGGVGGRALMAGARIAIGHSRSSVAHRWLGTREVGPVRVTAGPQVDAGILAALTATAWQVGQAVDRTGVRLVGSPLGSGGEIDTQGLLPGAIQVPPDGTPILMLADCPVTGGYRVPACVIEADVGRVAQLRPGDGVTLAVVGTDEARDAWRRMERELNRIEAADPRTDHEAGWAGSHG